MSGFYSFRTPNPYFAHFERPDPQGETQTDPLRRTFPETVHGGSRKELLAKDTWEKFKAARRSLKTQRAQTESRKAMEAETTTKLKEVIDSDPNDLNNLSFDLVFQNSPVEPRVNNPASKNVNIVRDKS